jgi:aldehyde dehydrogenase (NAD+)
MGLLAAAVFTQNINRAIDIAHKLQAGTVWVSLLSFRMETTSYS